MCIPKCAIKWVHRAGKLHFHCQDSQLRNLCCTFYNLLNKWCHYLAFKNSVTNTFFIVFPYTYKFHYGGCAGQQKFISKIYNFITKLLIYCLD